MPIFLDRFKPVPLGYAPTVLSITPRGQARLASVETNTSDTHPPCVCVCVCVCVFIMHWPVPWRVLLVHASCVCVHTQADKHAHVYTQ